MKTNHLQMAKLDELFAILSPVFDKGLKAKIWYSSGNWLVDLDTQGKSECVIRVCQEGFTALRRYGRQDPVETVGDIVAMVEGCKHGRTFFNSIWDEFITEYYGEGNHE